VTGADDGVARVFNAASGAEIAPLKKDGVEKVLSAAFSPDGTRIATGSSDGYVRIWDAASGRQIVKLNGLSEGYGVGFTDDAISAGPSPATSSTTMSVSRGVSPKARHNPDMPAGPSCPWEAGAKAQLRRPDRRQRLLCFHQRRTAPGQRRDARIRVIHLLGQGRDEMVGVHRLDDRGKASVPGCLVQHPLHDETSNPGDNYP
jgi:hypothetical protein